MSSQSRVRTIDGDIVQTRNALGGWKACLNPFTSLRKTIKRAANGDRILEQKLSYHASNIDGQAISPILLKCWSRLFLLSFAYGAYSMFEQIHAGKIVFNLLSLWVMSVLSLLLSLLLTMVFTFPASKCLKPRTPLFLNLEAKPKNPVMAALIEQDAFVLEDTLVRAGFAREEIAEMVTLCIQSHNFEHAQADALAVFPDMEVSPLRLTATQNALLERACRVVGVSTQGTDCLLPPTPSPVLSPWDELISLDIGLSERTDEISNGYA